MPAGGNDCHSCGSATSLLLGLIVSLVLHLSFVVSGSLFSGPSRTANTTAGVTIKAVLVSFESRPEVSRSEGHGTTIVHDAAPSVDTNKNESSPVDEAAAEGKKVGQDANKPAGLVESGRYHVRSELSQAPYVINDVLIMAPPTKGTFAWRLRIRLFLSESGFVDRLMVEDSTAPVYVEEDAIKQFRSARYSPGLIDGQQVKSQLLIDVTEP